MDEKIQVWAWVQMEDKENLLYYDYKLVWGGRSLIKAIWHAWIAKGYSGCVKIEWRGIR